MRPRFPNFAPYLRNFCLLALVLSAAHLVVTPLLERKPNSTIQLADSTRLLGRESRIRDDYAFYDVAVTISESEVRQLGAEPWRDVNGTVSISGSDPFSVRLHLKGNTTFEPITGRPNFTIKPQKSKLPNRDPLFHRKFHLLNCKQDPSMLRDKLARVIYSRCNVPVPDLAFAEVRLNERRLGFYTVSEGITKAFLNRSFGGDSGDLIEGDQQDVFSFASRTNSHFEATNLELANLRRFVAAEYLCGNGDGFVFNRNNYWIYRPTTQHQAFLFPHTCDAVFRNPRRQFATEWTPGVIPRHFEAEAERMAALALLRWGLSSTNCASLLSLLHSLGSNLVADIARRAPSVAMGHCRAINLLEEEVKLHWSNLNMCLEMEEGSRVAIETVRESPSWLLVQPKDRLGAVKFQRDGPMIHLAQFNGSNDCILATEAFMKPGKYRLTISAKRRGADSIARASIGANAAFSKARLLDETWQPLMHEFDVVISSSNRLFSAEQVLLQIRFAELLGTACVDVGHTKLVRLNPDEQN